MLFLTSLIPLFYNIEAVYFWQHMRLVLIKVIISSYRQTLQIIHSWIYTQSNTIKFVELYTLNLIIMHNKNVNSIPIWPWGNGKTVTKKWISKIRSQETLFCYNMKVMTAHSNQNCIHMVNQSRLIITGRTQNISITTHASICAQTLINKSRFKFLPDEFGDSSQML